MPGNTARAMQVAKDVEQNWTGDMIMVEDIVQQLQIPRYVLYIFNLGPMRHVVEKGSAGPRGGYIIEACEKGKPFSKPLIIPSIVTDTYMIENEIKTHSVTGEFMCRDIVHPYIAHSISGKEAGWSFGQNLDDFGVFWTKHNPPLVKDIEEARIKMEKTFRGALSEANMLEATDKLIDITPLMRHAADYYGEDRKWNKIYKRNAECPVCGGPMKEGIAVHTCGAVLNWPLAIAHSAKSFEDAKKFGVWTEDLEHKVAEVREALTKVAKVVRDPEVMSEAELDRLGVEMPEGKECTCPEGATAHLKGCSFYVAPRKAPAKKPKPAVPSK